MEETANGYPNIIELTADIVSSYVSNNLVPVNEVPSLIEEIFNTLNTIKDTDGPNKRPTKPAVPIDESITPDYLVCLEDGQKLKMLKRHLKSHFDLTPEEYRKRWGLPQTYPMVAPNYALRRRDLAQQIGLGKGRKKKS
jgi:predicted transcriptional regulator